MKRSIILRTLTVLAFIAMAVHLKAAAVWDHVTHESNASAVGVCDGSFVVDANYSATGTFRVSYTFEGSTTLLGPYDTPDDIFVTGLCAGTYSNITITSLVDATSAVWPSNIVISEPGTPQPYWICDQKKYQSIEVNNDYWLYEVETSPVNLKPVFNITDAGADDDLNSLIFNKHDGYMYIIQINSPHRLYRLGSDHSVVDLGPVSGFESNAGVNSGAENDNGDMIFRDTRNQDFYLLDLSSLSVTRMCDFSIPSGMDSNIGDFAYNPANGLYYGTRDDSDILAEIDLDNCTESHITLSDTIMSALGAFWIGADGKGYGYANADGSLYEIDLESGQLWLIGQGSSTSQTDGCSCEGISFHQEVDVDTIVEGDTLIMTYTVYNDWHTHLSTVVFSDTLCAGMTWASEPFNLTGGITIQPTSLTGTDKPDFIINNLPKGTCTFQIIVSIPVDYTAESECECQAHLGDLPARLGAPRPSDNPATPAIDDATSFRILQDNECVGNWNTPSIVADYDYNHLSVDVFSNKPLMNVVLDFYDGSTQMFNGLTNYTGIFAGYGANAGKCIVGVWARTACNASGEGPEYGEYKASTIWDGMCGVPEAAVIQGFNQHGSLVLSGGGTQINPPSLNHGDGPLNDGGINDDGHNSTGTGYEPPSYDPRGGRVNMFSELQVNIYPNPARSAQYIHVEGLDNGGSWTMHIFSMNGKYITARQVNNGEQIGLAELRLTSGIYFLEFENGVERVSAKLVVQE